MQRMMKLMTLFIILCGVNVFASMTSIYQVDVVIDKNMAASQEKAFYKGFQILAERMSIANADSLHVTNKQLMQTVSQYQYHEKEDKSILSIEFDKEALAELWASLDITPETSKKMHWVVWIASMKGDKHRLLGGTPLPSEVALLLEMASDSNYELIVPEMDLEDMDSLSFDDVWLENKARWAKASERYHAEGVLIVKLFKKSEGSWHATWMLSTDKDELKFSQNDSSLSLLFEKGINEIKQRLVVKEREPTEQQVYLEVRDVHSSENYQTILSFLRSLSGVEQVELDGVAPDKVLYRLIVRETKSRLKRQIKKNNLLIKEDKKEDKVLYYRLRT